jgi:hypothetical protein
MEANKVKIEETTGSKIPGEIRNEVPSSVGSMPVLGGDTLGGPRASAALQCELPHMLIGGVGSQAPHIPVDSESSCGIDWIAGSFPIEVFDLVVEYLEAIYTITPEYLDKGRYVYDQRITFEPYGCNVYYDSTKERADRLHNGKFSVEITGSGLQEFTANGLYKIIYDFIMTFRGKLSRVDLCYDDYKRRMTPSEIAEFAMEGLYTRFRTHTHLAKKKRNGDLLSDTLYFGSRGSGSGKYLRIYDKYLESKGKVDCIRYEIQFERDKARAVGIKLATAGSLEEFALLIGGLIAGSIDFIERKDKNIHRNDRLEWWSVIVSLLGECVLRNPKRVATIEKSVDFIVRIGSTIAMVKHALGDDDFMEFLEEITAIEEDSLPDRHKRLLDNYRALQEVPF